MGLWDALVAGLRSTRKAAGDAAEDAAARAALAGAKATLAAAAEDVLGDAEAHLRAEEAARAGQETYRPSAAQTDVDALIAGAGALEASHRTRPTPAADARAQALAELAALKAKKPPP